MSLAGATSPGLKVLHRAFAWNRCWHQGFFEPLLPALVAVFRSSDIDVKSLRTPQFREPFPAVYLSLQQVGLAK